MGGGNAKLRTLREATPSRLFPGRGLTRTELADLVVAHVWEHHGVDVPVDRKYVAKLETGRIQFPNERYRHALRDILAATDRQMGFVSASVLRASRQLELVLPADTGLDLPWTSAGALMAIGVVSEEEDALKRRKFLQLSGVALAELAIQWLVAPPSGWTEGNTGPQIIDHADVDQLDVVSAELRRMDDRLGGGQVLPMAEGQVRLVVRLLREGRYTDSVRRRLLSSAAELLRFCGWLAWDVAAHGLAHRYWQAALRSASAAGDDQVGANVLSFMTCQVAERGSAEHAMNVGAAARLRLTGSPRVAAIAHLCYAEAAGVAGADRECRLALDAAVHSFADTTSTSASPTWAYWLDPEHVDEMIGFSLLGLGDAAGAVEHLQAFVEGTDPGRERARGQAFLARAYVVAGEPEQACNVATDAVDLLVGDLVSPRCVDQIRRVQQALEPFDVPAVAEFNERTALLLG